MSASNSRRRCCCCDCTDIAPSACDICAGCTPLNARVVISGVTPFCWGTFITGFRDLDGDPNGTYLLTKRVSGNPCAWEYLENPGTTLNFMRVSGCGGSPTTQHLAWGILIQLVTGNKIQLKMGRASAEGVRTFDDIFSAELPTFDDCSTPLAFTNGSLLTPSGASGGSATLEWCPE